MKKTASCDCPIFSRQSFFASQARIEEEGKKSLNTPQTNEIGAAQKTLKPPLVRHLSHERPAKEKANGKRFLLHC